MKTSRIALAAAALPLAVAGAQAFAQAAPAARPTIAQICTNCHAAEPGTLRGVFENVAFKTRSIQLKIDNITEIVRFDDKTLKVVDVDKTGNVELLKSIAKNREMRVVYAERDGVKVASLVSFKGPIKIAPENLVDYATVERLVAAGPEKGAYTLIDSRPLPRFQEGAIPTAINLPYPAFDKFANRLPQDKARLLVFYCGGVTCMMSPNSMRRAAKMGYTNAKVYREGMPEWSQKNVGVIGPASLKQAWIDQGIPHVLIDARPAAEIKTGFIAGAVALAPEQLDQALPGFPAKALKAPIMVYDGGDGARALALARRINAAGYGNVNVIPGGMRAWQAAGYPLASGAAADKIAYVPKLRPGSIALDEFMKIAAATPADTLILDVRTRDEARDGMIKGALLIPDEELVGRLAEVPRDKRIITHCSSGVRAEMAYHKLKERGYNVAFLKASVEIDKSGKVTVDEN